MRYFDCHCDTPYAAWKAGCGFAQNDLAVSAEKGRFLEKWQQCFAVWIRDDAEDPFALYREILTDFQTKLTPLPDLLTPLFMVEGGAVIEDDPDRVDRLWQDGIRLLTLTWNGRNRLASGSAETGTLTALGREVIDRMNRKGMAVDLSHLNRESYFAVLERAERPIVTHAACDAVCPHPRNLNREQLTALRLRGGLFGLCFYPVFLGPGDVFEQIHRHLTFLCEQGLEKQIAFGSDFDGADMAPALSSLTDLPSLYAQLERRGWAKDLLNGFFYENAAEFARNL